MSHRPDEVVGAVPRHTQAGEALSEAIDIIRASWAGQPFRHQGKHYPLRARRSPARQPGDLTNDPENGGRRRHRQHPSQPE